MAGTDGWSRAGVVAGAVGVGVSLVFSFLAFQQQNALQSRVELKEDRTLQLLRGNTLKDACLQSVTDVQAAASIIRFSVGYSDSLTMVSEGVDQTALRELKLA